ncbi:MAG: hypothetical protein WDN49_14730 [Acetobacteraceae bacterium]
MWAALAEMLARVTGRVRTMRLERVSPLAVPVLLDIGRESVRSEDGEDALLAETEALVAEATGEPGATAEPSRALPPPDEARAPDRPGRRTGIGGPNRAARPKAARA